MVIESLDMLLFVQPIKYWPGCVRGTLLSCYVIVCIHTTKLLCKTERQYLLTCKVSRYRRPTASAEQHRRDISQLRHGVHPMLGRCILGSMLAHRPRRLPNIKTTLGERLVFSGKYRPGLFCTLFTSEVPPPPMALLN